jgi:hypothetical protein
MIAAAFAVLAPVGAAPKKQPQTVVIPLKHAPGSMVAMMFSKVYRSGNAEPEPLSIEGLDYMAVDTVHNAVLAAGTQKALKELRDLVASCDTKPRSITIELRLIRTVQQADGSLKSEVVATPTVTTLSNQEATVTINDDKLRMSAVVLPRLNGDDTLTITAELRAERGSGAGAYHRSTRRLAQGRSRVFAHLPDVFSETPKDARIIGIVPEKAGEAPGYDLEITARETP